MPSVSAGLKTRSPGLKSGAGTTDSRLSKSAGATSAERFPIKPKQAATKAKAPKFLYRARSRGFETRFPGLKSGAGTTDSRLSKSAGATSAERFPIKPLFGSHQG